MRQCYGPLSFGRYGLEREREEEEEERERRKLESGRKERETE